jgi:ribosomal protein S27E
MSNSLFSICKDCGHMNVEYSGEEADWECCKCGGEVQVYSDEG